MKLKKPICSGLLATLLLANLAMPAFAYNSQGSTTNRTDGADTAQGVQTEYHDGINASTADTDVYATRSSTFTALVPKTIILNGSDGKGLYVVGAKGDVLAEDAVSIEPASYELVLQKVGDTSKTVAAAITQEQTSVTGAQIETATPAYATMEGSIQADNLKAGSWKSTVTFNIRLVEAASKHEHTLTHVEAVGESSYHPAIIEHYECETCNKYYSDANGENEISEYDTYTGLTDFALDENSVYEEGINIGEEDIVIPAIFYSSANSKWYKVTSFGLYKYRDMTIHSLTIPSTVTSIDIGSVTIIQCYNFESVNVANENPSFVSIDGVLYNKDKTELVILPGGLPKNELEIPDSVTTINQSNFDFHTLGQLETVVYRGNAYSNRTDFFNAFTSIEGNRLV